MAGIKQMYEDGKKIQPYFPLMRYGQYWARVGKGANSEFHMFESIADREVFLRQRARQANKTKEQMIEDEDVDVGNNLNEAKKGETSAMLKNIFESVNAGTKNIVDDFGNVAGGSINVDKFKDEVYQMFLQSLPERSFRKQFIHAEKVTGFSADILRNFKTSATAHANQLSKLRYNTEISNTIQRARDSLQGMPAAEKCRLELFINEMATRTQEEINPPPEGQLATRVNQFAFIMLLTSPASAATQMASVPIMVMPTLGAEYGYGKASVQFLKMLNVFKTVGRTSVDPETGNTETTMPSLASSDMARRNPNLNRAFQEAAEKYNLFSLFFF
jgi:hypothetical protein